MKQHRTSTFTAKLNLALAFRIRQSHRRPWLAIIWLLANLAYVLARWFGG